MLFLVILRGWDLGLFFHIDNDVFIFIVKHYF